MLSEATVLDAGDAQAIDVLSSTPGFPGEVLALDLTGDGSVVSLVVCVTDTRPMVVGGAVGHAVRLLTLDESRSREWGAGDPATRAEVVAAPDLVGVLVRESDVYVINVSGSGCLVEASSPLESGTSATLTVKVGGEEFTDPVRVTRCDRIEGAGSRYLLGTEFLWTTAPGPGSLRRAARNPQRMVSRPMGTAVMQPPLVM